MRSPTQIPPSLLIPPLLLALPSLLAPLLLLPRGTAARVFTLGYITGSRRRPGDFEYSRPGLTISGAASLAVAEVNGEPTPPYDDWGIPAGQTDTSPDNGNRSGDLTSAGTPPSSTLPIISLSPFHHSVPPDHSDIHNEGGPRPNRTRRRIHKQDGGTSDGSTPGGNGGKYGAVVAGRVFGGDPGKTLRSMGHRLELRVAETYGEEAESIRAAARLWRDGVDAYLGPQETCVHEGRMAAAFNLPMVSYFCTHRETSDKKRYPTFARTRPPDTQICKSVVSLLLHFNWTQVAFLHQTSIDSEFSAVASTLLAALDASGIGVRSVRTWSGPFHLGYMDNPFLKILEDTKENARVYVVLGHYHEHIGLLVAMDEMELLESGDYFVVGVDSSDPYDSSTPTKYFAGPLLDRPHPRAISASRSYLAVLPSPSPVLLSSAAQLRPRTRPLALPRPSAPGIRRFFPAARVGGVRKNGSYPDSVVTMTSAQQAADRFSALVNLYMELPPFSFKNPLVSLGVAVKIPPEAAYLYDAIHLYTRALESVLLSGGDPRNGTAIIEAMRGARYFSAMGYIVSLDRNGDAGGNYTVIGRKLVPSGDGGQMEYAMVPVGRFYAPAPPATKGAGGAGAPMGTMNEGLTKDTLPELRMLRDVDWVNGEPPLAEPSCGFAGEKCITYTAEIVASVAGGVALTLAVIGLVLYRNWRYEQALDSLLWKVDFRDIQMYEPGEQTAGPAAGTTNGSVVNQTNNTNRITRPLIRTSQASLSSNPDAEWRRGVAYTPVGIYRGRPFAIKKLQSFRQRPLAVDRAMKKELKMMRDLRHDNLVCFIGACTEPPNVCIVTEYCARGSLRDILENEDLKLDNMFVASLIGDILRGMIFLHDSPIRSHGSLRPSNCLVDSRWVLKIADFGLHLFKREADARPLKHVHDYMAMSQDYHSSTGEPGSKIGGSGSRRRKRCDSSSQQHSESSASKEAMDEARNYIESVLYKAPELLRAAVSSYYVTTPSPEEGISWGQALAKALPSDPVPLASVMAAAWDSRPDLWPGTQRGDAYAFGMVVYELHARQGPFGTNAMPGITQSDILKRVMAGSQDDTPFRPPLDSLETSFDFVRDCLKECWAECAEDRPDFRSIRLKLRPIRKGMKPNIFDNMMAMMEKYANNLEQLVDERTDQLIVEKRKTDALLYEMLPRCVAEQLKRGHRVEAESYDCVTIYFSDIVGFTAMSAESTPLQVVDFLNDLYTCFDSILENYDVYKVETIGDAYMVVSGLPLRNGEQHAAEIASMSLHLLSAVTKFRIRHRPNDPLQLRIGIHSGPVCAGVVGLKMPRYCLFGDTVNTTSRMESNGIPLKIHCSSECRAILDRLGGYRLVSRGLVNMKGKGDVLTHWLLGEDSEGEDGIPDVARNTPKCPEAVGLTSKEEGVDIVDGSTDPPKQDDADLMSDGRESTSASQGTLSPGGQAVPSGNTDPGVSWKNDVMPKENSSVPDMNRIRSHRSLTPPLRGDNPISAPVRSSMRKHHPGTGEWHGGEGISYAAHGLPGHSSLRKHHAFAGVGGGGGMRRGGFRGRRRSLESSPKKLRFASEVVGEGAGIERPIGDGNTGKKSGETEDIGKAPEAVIGAVSVGGTGAAVKEKQGEGTTEGDKQRRMSKMKRRRRKAADGSKGSSTGEWKLLLSNTVPPWRRRGKSAECLEREDPWAWDLTMGRIGVGGLPAFYNQTAYQKLGVPRGGFPYPVNERGIPKARSIASMGGASATSGHLDAHAIRDGAHMDRNPVDFFRSGSGKLAASPADRLNVPMIQSGMYSSTSCESNQSQEWSDCGAANSAEELDDGGRRVDGSTEWKAFGEGEGGHTTHFNGSPVGVIAGEEEGLLEGGEWSPIRGMEEGRGAEFDGGYRAGGRTLDRIDGYAEDGSGGDEELVRPLLPSVGGGNTRI